MTSIHTTLIDLEARLATSQVSAPRCRDTLARLAELVAPGIGTDALLAPVAQEPGSPVPFGVR